MKKLLLAVLALCSFASAEACTNFIATRGATTDGSVFVTYSADDYGMFGKLCHYAAGKHAKGTKREIVDYDSGESHGFIDEASETYNVIGNINEYQVSIGETTYGGRKEMVDNTGLIDYGSLMYLGLQRSKTAREAIKIMTDLVEKYGYQSSGESFTIADPDEVWILEMMGCGGDKKQKVVWVAVRIPDGMISGHANQARIGQFSTYNTDVMKSKNCIKFAREKGWFSGKDKDFNWKMVYAAPDFGGRRHCDEYDQAPGQTNRPQDPSSHERESEQTDRNGRGRVDDGTTCGEDRCGHAGGDKRITATCPASASGAVSPVLGVAGTGKLLTITRHHEQGVAD